MRLVARNTKTGSAIFAIGCLPLLAILAFWGTIGYVAFHFIAKFW